jgi:hypothetical protein
MWKESAGGIEGTIERQTIGFPKWLLTRSN